MSPAPDPIHDQSAAPVIRLSDPTEVVAGLPALFGFRPRESLIFLAVERPRGRLGFRARVDLPVGDEVADAATSAPLATLATASPDDAYVALGSSTSPFGRGVFQASGVLALTAPPCTVAGCPEALHPGRMFLYHFNPKDGSLRWHRPIGAWPMAPVLTRRDSLLLVDRPPNAGCEEDYSCTGDDSHHDSFLRELNVEDGRELAACALPGKAPYITPPALHRGRVVLGAWTNWLASNDWTRRMSIRAFKLSVPTEPAKSGWVTAGGGNTRSGTPQVRP